MFSERIHLSKVWDIMQQKDARGNYVPFSFSYAKLDGTLTSYKMASFSSIHAKGSTVNIIPQGELKPKTFRKILILSINHYKVYL